MDLETFMNRLKDGYGEDEVKDYAEDLSTLIDEFLDEYPNHSSADFLISVQDWYRANDTMTPKQALGVWRITSHVYDR